MSSDDEGSGSDVSMDDEFAGGVKGKKGNDKRGNQLFDDSDEDSDGEGAAADDASDSGASSASGDDDDDDDDESDASDELPVERKSRKLEKKAALEKKQGDEEMQVTLSAARGRPAVL